MDAVEMQILRSHQGTGPYRSIRRGTNPHANPRSAFDSCSL